MVLLIIIPTKWLFHWGFGPHFQTYHLMSTVWKESCNMLATLPPSSSQARLQSSLAFKTGRTGSAKDCTVKVEMMRRTHDIWHFKTTIHHQHHFSQKTPSCHPCQVEFNRIFVCLQLIPGKLFFPAFSCGHCSILWFNPCVTVMTSSGSMTSSMPLPTPTANGAQAWGKLTAASHKIRCWKNR